MALLGVKPSSVTTPSSGKALALGLLNGLDYRGNWQAGLAVDTRPWLLMRGDTFTLSEYRNKPLQRQLSRFRLSFATASGQSDQDKADRFSLGLAWTPWDQGDPRLDRELDACYNEKLGLVDSQNDTLEKEKATLTPEAFEKRDKALAAAAHDCVRKSQQRNWNASAWDLGVAGYNANADGIHQSGYALWTSLALKIPRTSWGQFIAHARMHERQLVPEQLSESEYRVQDSWSTGARLRLGSSRGYLMLEGAYEEVDPDNGDSFSNTRAALGVELKLVQGIWLQLALADTFGDNPDDDSTVMSGQLRWGFSDSRLLGLKQTN
jgi:hypothetical protein